MFNWVRRRRLGKDARRKLLIALARAEETLVETHVDNVFELMDLLGGEIDLNRGIELYVEAMSLQESLASTVANRVLARLGGSDSPVFRNVFNERA
ncbi:MAG: hypothetical protein ACREKN_07070 [Longimicrobiaceae bacterium]